MTRAYRVNHSGKEIDGWLVLRRDDGRRWWCRHLACGTEKSVPIYQFSSNNGGGVRCDSCYVPRKNSEYIVVYKLWKSIRAGAKQRELELQIDMNSIWELLKQQNYRCALTGLPLVLVVSKDGWDKSSETTASLDRIDSNKGYVPSNIQWVHKTINRMKMDLNESEFKEFCRLVTEKSTLSGLTG